MKKNLKITLITIISFIAIILIDTIQAKIFNNSPLIKIRENYNGGTLYYMDKGIFVNSYKCNNGEKHTMFKQEEFACPLNIKNTPEIIQTDNLNEIENVSMIIKEGTLTKTSATIIITDLSGKDYTYGQSFRIDKFENGLWKEAEKTGEDYVFVSIGYKIDKNNQLEMNQDWSHIYKKLEKGKYRLVKEIALHKKYFSVEFEID